MQKLIFLLFLLTISFSSFSQNIEEYHKSINHAELAIVDSNYQQAVIDYELAFKVNPQPFGKDIYNFAICNLFESNFQKSLELFQQLVDLEYDTKNFDELKATELGKSIPKSFFQKLEKLQPSGRIKLNYPLKKTLQQLYDRDQYFRKKEGSYQVYGDTIKKIDEFNDAELRLLIKTHGWPNEYLIGVKQNLYPGLNFDITIWHQTTLNHISGWVDDIKDAIWTGKLEPHRGASLIENHVGNDSYLTHPFMKLECANCSLEINEKIKGKIYYMVNSKNNEHIDQFREGIYLEKFEDFVIKFNFDRIKNKNFKFFYYSNCSTWQFNDEKDIITTLEGFQVLD